MIIEEDTNYAYILEHYNDTKIIKTYTVEQFKSEFCCEEPRLTLINYNEKIFMSLNNNLRTDLTCYPIPPNYIPLFLRNKISEDIRDVHNIADLLKSGDMIIAEISNVNTNQNGYCICAKDEFTNKKISFDFIMQQACNFINHISPMEQDDLFIKLNKGVNELSTESLMNQYFASYGNMHQAKLNYAFDQIPKDFFNYDKIRIIDYGCGQAIGEMIYKDYLNKNNITQNVAEIILIEPSEKCLARAALHSKVFYPTSEITTIKKYINDLTKQDISNKSYLPTLHIFSNVLDIEDINLEYLADTINNTMDNIVYNQFLCVGPYFGLSDKTTRLHSLSNLISNINQDNIYSKDFSQNQFNVRKQWTCSVCVFNNNIVQKKNPEEQLLSDKIQNYKKAAEQGDATAQNNLGDCYYKGEGIEQDYEQAVYWYKKAAEQGHLYAQNHLGYCYDSGQGVEQDYEQAVYWCTKAAEQGFADAQNNLGCYYLAGQGVGQNYQQAVYWFEKVAKQGHATAQNNLAKCYYFGEGVERDYKQAVYWYKKAAEQGLANAQNNLGNCYKNSQGVEQDYKQAVYWYKKAAEQEDEIAQNNLGNCYYKGEGIERDYEQAVYWYKKAAEQGNATAQNNLGNCYKNGLGVEKNLDKAKNLWRKIRY
jgi:TPR repeat protein